MFDISCNYATTIDKSNSFIASIREGEKIRVETINAYGGYFQNKSDIENLINDKQGKYHHHPLTGPIRVENAKRGDVLKVHIDAIEIGEMAISLSRTTGIDPIVDGADRTISIGDKRDQEFIYDNVSFSLRPMIGIIATTGDDLIKTGHAGKCGGNLDLPFVTEGVDVYLPVLIDGAGLYLGDVHAAQGYGELSGIAMEASSKVIFTVEVLKVEEPIENVVIYGREPFSNEECLGVVGVGAIADITSSVRDAFLGMTSVIERIVPDKSFSQVKEIITLIGNSFLGQAYSKTSESTSIVVIKKRDLEKLKR